MPSIVRKGMFIELPLLVVKEIKRRAKKRALPQWKIVTEAINQTQPVKQESHV